MTIGVHPSMRLGMGRSIESTTQQTKAGHILNKRKSTTKPDWFYPSWALSGTGLRHVKKNYWGNMYRQGRKKYSLNYAFLEDSEVLPAILTDYSYGYDEYNESNAYGNVMNTGDDIYNKFLRKTSNGVLPFIFSPNQENTPSNFGIYRLDSSPSIRQSAYGRYDLDLKMTEIY